MIIDTHAHIGEVDDFKCFDIDVDHLVKRLDQLKIDCVISASYHGMWVPEFEQGIVEGIEMYEKTGKRVYSYFNFNPKHSEECLKIMEKYKDEPSCVAIKIHPSLHHYFGDDELYRPVWEFAKKHNLPIMSHTWALSSYNPNQRYAVPGLFEKYLKEYPEVKFTFGHSGGRTNGVIEAAALGKKYANAYLDIAGDPFEAGVVEKLVGEATSKKVVFGSDVMWFDPSAQIGMVLGADITDEDRENIFYKTAFGLYPQIKKDHENNLL